MQHEYSTRSLIFGLVYFVLAGALIAGIVAFAQWNKQRLAREERADLAKTAAATEAHLARMKDITTREPGRFQLVDAEPAPYLLDTASGTLWWPSFNATNSRWLRLDGPDTATASASRKTY